MDTRAVVVVVVVVAVVVSGDATGKLATRYDYVNLDVLFNSKRLLGNYVDCLMGKKHCPPEGMELKKHLPDLLATTCRNCTPRQRDILVKITMRMDEEFPQQLRSLRKRWDPTGRMYARLQNYMEKSYPQEMQNRAVREANRVQTQDNKVTQDTRRVKPRRVKTRIRTCSLH